MANKKNIKISEVLGFLDNGMSRQEIATELDITMADCRRLFKNELLKGKKAKRQVDFIITDDVTETADAELQTSVAEEVTVNDSAVEELVEEQEEVATSPGSPSAWEN